MPAILPVILAASHLVLVSDVPRLNVEPSCRAAAQAAIGQNRDTNACLRDENQARDTLQKEWSDYSGGERERCLRLSQLGGMPSYVELLTCLQMAKDLKGISQSDYGLGAGLTPSDSAKPAKKKK
jgi:hypothetical protein